METLGERIKWARITANLSQTELGQKLGYGDKAKSRISNWETNTSKPSVEELAKLCYILQTPPNVLVPVELEDIKIETLDLIRNQKIKMLNVAGRKKVDDFINDLLLTNKYGIDIDPVTGQKLSNKSTDISVEHNYRELYGNDYLYHHPAFNEALAEDDLKEAHGEP